MAVETGDEKALGTPCSDVLVPKGGLQESRTETLYKGMQ